MLSCLIALGTSSLLADSSDGLFIPSKMHVSYKVCNEAEKDSLNNIWYQSENSFGTPEWWKVVGQDTTFYVDESRIRGLIMNDFSEFFYNEPIGQMSELRRNTSDNIEEYTRAKALMESIRDGIYKKGIIVPSKGDEWILQKEYDIQNERFIFGLYSVGIRIPDSQKDIDSKYNIQKEYGSEIHRINGRISYDPYDLFRLLPYVPENLFGNFVTESKLDIFRRSYEGPSSDLIVPIKNHNVALMIEDASGAGFNSYSPIFRFYFKSKMAYPEDPKLTDLVIEDILLVHEPTGQVVWSAKTGDHSNEVKL